MKIFVIGTRGFPNIQGGVEKHCENLYPLLASRNCTITVFRRKSYVVAAGNSSNCIRFIDLFSTRIRGVEAFLHSFLSTISCLMMKRPDIVHIHNIGPGFFIPLLKLVRLNVLLTYHSPNYEHTKWRLPEKCFLRLCEKISLKLADKVIFVSEQQMKKFPQIQHKSILIPNGIKFPGSDIQKKTSFLDKKGLHEKDYILFVGRLAPEKGVDVLLRAFKKIRTDKKLVIAGAADNDKAYINKLNKIAQNSNHIIFTGFVTGYELSWLYKNAYVFVLPSYHEGHPIVILEAMSYGLPIIASDIAANKEIKLPSGSFFTAGNIQSLAHKLDEILHQKVHVVHYDMIQYNWENISQQTLEVYNEIMTGGKRSFRTGNLESTKTLEETYTTEPSLID